MLRIEHLDSGPEQNISSQKDILKVVYLDINESKPPTPPFNAYNSNQHLYQEYCMPSKANAPDTRTGECSGWKYQILDSGIICLGSMCMDLISSCHLALHSWRATPKRLLVVRADGWVGGRRGRFGVWVIGRVGGWAGGWVKPSFTSLALHPHLARFFESQNARVRGLV